MDRKQTIAILQTRTRVSIAESAEILGFTERTVRKGVHAGAIPSIRATDQPNAKRYVPTAWIARQLHLDPASTEAGSETDVDQLGACWELAGTR